MKAVVNFKSDSAYRVNAHTLRTQAFHKPRGTGLVLALVAIILFAGSALIAHGIAQAGAAREPLAKPDASLLHSNPNASMDANEPVRIAAPRTAL